MSVALRRLLANLAACAAMVSAYVLWRFPPETTPFYPRCPVYLWLHLYCPGCGGTRAVAALLHGRVMEAMHWNAAVVLLLPLVACFLLVTYARAVGRQDFRWPHVPDSWLKVLLALTTLFFIIRNIPAYRLH